MGRTGRGGAVCWRNQLDAPRYQNRRGRSSTTDYDALGPRRGARWKEVKKRLEYHLPRLNEILDIGVFMNLTVVHYNH